MTVKPTPEGFHTVTPSLVVRGAAQLIDFLKQAFDAEETFRLAQPDGTIAHAEVKIGDSMVMISEAEDEKPMPARVHLYVEDVDMVYRRALQAGATSLIAPENRFYGDRAARVQDASGTQWGIATHIEDVSADEIVRRAVDLMKQSD